MFFAGFVCAAAYMLAESTVHPHRHRPSKDATARAQEIARESNAVLIETKITARDGTELRAWYFSNNAGNGAVLLYHGQANNREGMLTYVPIFLRHGYSVLDPDSRAHGDSGGTVASYGLRESGDVTAWIDWLMNQKDPSRIFGLGESMGAAILLQSMAQEKRFAGLIAECSFANFRDIARDRISMMSGFRAGGTIFAPVIEASFIYARLRYKLNFSDASPEAAVRNTTIPIFLIHGDRDNSIPVHHAEKIFAANPKAIEFWRVPEARHSAAFGKYPEEFERRVITFLSSITAEPKLSDSE